MPNVFQSVVFLQDIPPKQPYACYLSRSSHPTGHGRRDGWTQSSNVFFLTSYRIIKMRGIS